VKTYPAAKLRIEDGVNPGYRYQAEVIATDGTAIIAEILLDCPATRESAELVVQRQIGKEWSLSAMWRKLN
jgi:hypothetical protein